MTEHNIEGFLKELGELTKTYGLEINGCGCCGSPYIAPLPKGREKGRYIAEDSYLEGVANNLYWSTKGAE